MKFISKFIFAISGRGMDKLNFFLKKSWFIMSIKVYLPTYVVVLAAVLLHGVNVTNKFGENQNIDKVRNHFSLPVSYVT